MQTFPAQDLALVDVAALTPRAGELLLDVEACGICGTDLHILAGKSYRPNPPFVLGHEPVGRVSRVGAGVSPDWLGRRVTMTLFTGCGTCADCLRGDERLCPDLTSIHGVLAAPGGFAEEMVVPESAAVAAPTDLTAAEVAALVDAGATAANAAEVVLGHDASSVLVIGGGPVGFLTVELLAAAGVAAFVVEPLPARRAALERRGYVVAETIDGVAGPFTVVVDCAGAPSVVSAGLSALAPRGLFVVVGYTTVPSLDLAVIARRELLVRGIRSGSRAHLEAALGAAARRVIALPPISVWDLEQINEALAELRSGRVAGKAVITPPNERSTDGQTDHHRHGGLDDVVPRQPVDAPDRGPRSHR
jgi:2-desacetyl-2-hydroxyethyl bacteriochlorophyllide A dehydrogenase